MNAENITQQDILQFTAIPYSLSGKILIKQGEYSLPTAYMELDRKNQRVAIVELERINDILAAARRYIRSMPRWATIKTRKIIFSRVSPFHGYTKLICTPYTPTGRIAKHPIQLSFMTDLDERNTYTASGELYYGTNGKVLKAEAYIWNRTLFHASRDGWFFSLRMLNGELTVTEVKTSLGAGQYGLPRTVYKI